MKTLILPWAFLCFFGEWRREHLFADDQPQLLAELALDQAEFNQSLPKVDSLQSIEINNLT